jgi:reverse gyrase
MTEPSDRACADCGMAMSDDETWVCEDCDSLYMMIGYEVIESVRREDGDSHRETENP